MFNPAAAHEIIEASALGLAPGDWPMVIYYQPPVDQTRHQLRWPRGR